MFVIFFRYGVFMFIMKTAFSNEALLAIENHLLSMQRYVVCDFRRKSQLRHDFILELRNHPFEQY